ncbi:hypothetical protein [Xylanimonas sp. McL0601]|uniref:hypothetical protein n=1 Tax=Xylanimonas sp. McL0601 TaxID=3414739 RepID=UPI003CE69462
MSEKATIEPVADLVVIQETVTSYVIRPEALASIRPTTVPTGTYVARFDSGGVGDPTFAVLPYTDGRSAQTITLAEAGEVTDRSPRYMRAADRADAVDYRLRMPVSFPGWAPPSPEVPA